MGASSVTGEESKLTILNPYACASNLLSSNHRNMVVLQYLNMPRDFDKGPIFGFELLLLKDDAFCLVFLPIP